MQYRRFGRTEIQMPVFSCGGMRYQQTWDDAPLEVVEAENQRNLEATIHRAFELGINHIETARDYGTSERQLGLVLPKIAAERGRENLIVQSKVAPLRDAGLFRQHVLESLDRLQLEYIDLLGLHGINNHQLLSLSTRPGGCLEVARELQAEGKVKHVGFSTHGLTDMIIDAINTDCGEGFDYINLHWYYINQWNWRAVEAARRRDMGLFIISPTAKGGMLNTPSERLSELCEPFHPIVFNCLFCLSRPEIHTLSLGASCPADFDLQMSSIPLLEQAETLLQPILARLRTAMVAAVGEQVADQFTDGLPEWEKSPGYMNLPVILWLRNLALAYDMTEYGKMRYNLLGNGSHWFPGLNAEHVDQLDAAQMQKALKDSPFAEQIPGWLSETHQLLGGETVQRLSQS